MAIKVHFMISLLSWHAQQVGATGLWEMCETAQRSPSLPFRESFSGQSRRAANPARARRWGDRIAVQFVASAHGRLWHICMDRPRVASRK
jgi:hypothetical protein